MKIPHSSMQHRFNLSFNVPGYDCTMISVQVLTFEYDLAKRKGKIDIIIPQEHNIEKALARMRKPCGATIQLAIIDGKNSHRREVTFLNVKCNTCKIKYDYTVTDPVKATVKFKFDSVM